PIGGAFTFQAFLERTEEIGAVASYLALVRDPREPAGAGKHREQRKLGERHARIAVIGENDFVAGKRQLVAAARRRPLDDAEVVLTRRRARIFHGKARLVSELAEVHFVGMARAREHADIGARAEDALLARAEHDDLHAWMFEAQALHGIGKLDV